MTQAEAERFAADWIAAWNRHDLDAILSHYSGDIEFTSPFVGRLLGDEDGVVRGINALRDYFGRALAAYPDLWFSEPNVLASPEVFVIYYRSVNDLWAAELMRTNQAGKIDRVSVTYTNRSQP